MDSAKYSFGTFSDDALAKLSKDGDESAFNELVMRYLGKITSIARKYSAQGYEQNDFVQEGLMGLLYAVKTNSFPHSLQTSVLSSNITHYLFSVIICPFADRSA